MKEKETPLIKQYTQIKNKYPDSVLLFRMGDFFETFNDDAAILSKVCGIVLTKRNQGGTNETPLAGFPHHQLDSYLPKLVRAGYRVAVCEQIEDPKHARGIVRRDVIEVVTPGVALYDKLLDTQSNNYIVSLVDDNKLGIIGFACADISTGEFFTSEFTNYKLIEVILSFSPSEVIINKEQKNYFIELFEKNNIKTSLTKLDTWIFDFEFGKEALLGHFKTQTLKGFGIEEQTLGIIAAGAILHYVNETQKNILPQIHRITNYNTSDFMILDASTRRNLEITLPMGFNTQLGTLISILDKTKTSMGSRLLKKWITRPLNKLEPIHKRLESVRVLLNKNEIREYIRIQFTEIGDLERLISKICTGRANPRDIIALRNSLLKIAKIISISSKLNCKPLESLINHLKTMHFLFSSNIFYQPIILLYSY